MASPLTPTITDPTSVPSSPSARMATVLVSPSSMSMLVVANETVRRVLAFALNRDNQIRTGGDVAKFRSPHVARQRLATKLNVTISSR